MAAGGLAEDRNVPGVAAEGRDVVTHPLHRELLILQAVVPSLMRFAVERALRDESQVAEAIVDRHDDHAPPDERSRVVIGSGASGQAAAMNPEHHGRLAMFLSAVLLRHVDVQEQAVLSADSARLSALAAERRRVEHALPAAVWLRRHPAQVADGGSGVRDAEVLVDVAANDAAKLAAGGHDHGRHWYFMDFLGVGRGGAESYSAKDHEREHEL